MWCSKNWLSTVCLLAVFNSMFFLQQGFAQEKVVPLQYNPVLQNHEAANSSVARKKKKEADTLTLPFFDDFSYEGPYPDDELWLDSNVYVNSQLAIEPMTYGVATFDGLNEFGDPYNPNRDNNNFGLPTDTLTSTYIDLSDLNALDDIYLSFFYQPKGLGDEPERVDSLLVQIKSSEDSNQWKTIWRIGGGKDYDPVPDFKPVILPIDYPDSAGFYHEGFQFRFMSYGNLSGNLDNWHVDYIQMGRNRNPGDTFRRDVGIVRPPLGLLEEYREVPWSQFDESYLRDQVSITARNMDQDDTFAVQFGYSIVDLIQEQEVAENFSENFVNNIFNGYDLFTDDQQNLFDRLDFPGRDSVRLMLNAAITESLNDETRANDTFQKELFFQHYFAYDDATAEGGYGLTGFYESGKVAQRFSLNNRDTLRAVGIKFNQSEENVRGNTFDLKVWSDLGPLNQPDGNEQLLTVERGVEPSYHGRGHDGFVIYELEEPVVLGGVFYIGWEQYQEYNLNVGLDKGYSRHSGQQDGERKIFYNHDGSWQRSSTPKTEGAVMMIRPYVGGDSINYYNKVTNESRKSPEPGLKVNAYPNPVKNQLNLEYEIRIASSARLDVKLYDFSGKKLIQTHVSSQGGQLDMSGLPPGMYLLKVRNSANGAVVHKKVIKE